MAATTVCRLREAVVIVAACCAAHALPAVAQGPGAPAERAAAAEPPAPPDVVVRGRGFAELRLRIRLAEEAVFARFNDINSTDDFDIHCYEEAVTGSRILRRACMSNSWREQDENIAKAVLGQMRNEFGANPQHFVAQQHMMQGRLSEEVRRLVLEDKELGEAVLELGQARLALAQNTNRQDNPTAWREVQPGADGLPYDAAQVFEVRVGTAPWTHLLTQRTFAFAGVAGDIRALVLDCREDEQKIDYLPDVEWTVPAGWSSCILEVRAKKGTMFALLEF